MQRELPMKRKASAAILCGLALLAVTLTDSVACDAPFYDKPRPTMVANAVTGALRSSLQAFPYSHICDDGIAESPSLLSRLPLAQLLAIPGRAQVFRWDSQLNATSNPAVFDLYSSAGAVLGGGLELAMRPRLNLTLDWARYSVDNDTIHALAMGISYRFD
jgi:hypothetical protein